MILQKVILESVPSNYDPPPIFRNMSVDIYGVPLRDEIVCDAVTMKERHWAAEKVVFYVGLKNRFHAFS